MYLDMPLMCMYTVSLWMIWLYGSGELGATRQCLKVLKNKITIDEGLFDTEL